MSNTQAERVEALRCLAFDYVRSDEDELGKFVSELTALVAENEALRADAERYRWIRSHQHDGSTLPYIARPDSDCLDRWTYRNEEADAAIDAARNTTHQQGG